MAEIHDAVRCVWVLSGSPEPRLPSTFDWITTPDRVVAADAGAALAARLGLKPDILVGDFDSIEPELRARYDRQSVEVRVFQHDTKQETDTELAVLAALEWQPRQIYIFGAMGGRLDHALANVMLLAHPALHATDARLIEENQELYIVRAGRENIVSGNIGDRVTVIPVSGDAEGVRNAGFQYPLAGETLPMGYARGVSNVLTAREARIWLDKGELLVIVAHATA